jgi:hypothetical protein
VRHCNWIRFVSHVTTLTDSVNLIGRIIRGEVIYETIQNIAPNTELIVYYDVKKLNDSCPTLYPSLLASTPLMRAHHHTFICRQTLQGISHFFFHALVNYHYEFVNNIVVGVSS